MHPCMATRPPFFFILKLPVFFYSIEAGSSSVTNFSIGNLILITVPRSFIADYAVNNDVLLDIRFA